MKGTKKIRIQRMVPPAVSLSVGVAFADRENPGESIFKDADKTLYRVKENGRNGCDFY